LLEPGTKGEFVIREPERVQVAEDPQGPAPMRRRVFVRIRSGAMRRVRIIRPGRRVQVELSVVGRHASRPIASPITIPQPGATTNRIHPSPFRHHAGGSGSHGTGPSRLTMVAVPAVA